MHLCRSSTFLSTLWFRTSRSELMPDSLPKWGAEAVAFAVTSKRRRRWNPILTFGEGSKIWLQTAGTKRTWPTRKCHFAWDFGEVASVILNSHRTLACLMGKGKATVKWAIVNRYVEIRDSIRLVSVS